MTIFEHHDYKAFVRTWVEEQPKQGRGLLSRMAEHVSMSPAMMSQVLGGDKHFSIEAANDAANFMALDEEETDYFIQLVIYSRAGTPSLRARCERKIAAAQKRANEVSTKMRPDRELPETAKTLFYSHWSYSAIRNMTACPQFQSIDRIADHLNISRASVQRIVDFLIDHGLCVLKKGKLDVGPQVTHAAQHTPLAFKHHQNWRLNALNKMFEPNDRNAFFTSPMSLSNEAAARIRARIPEFIKEVRDAVGPSRSEVVRCLNIDWFEY